MKNSNDYHHINCHVLLVCADALHPDQLQRMRDNQNGLTPLNDESIDQILEAWRRKLRREIQNNAGYFVLGYDS